MIKNFDIQLQVSLRALREIVAPSLEGAEKHVLEQLHLAIATLDFVKTRLPEARRYYRMELQSYLDLAKDAVSLVGSEPADAAERLSSLVQDGTILLQNPEADLPDYEEANANLREALALLSSRTVGMACQQALETMILQRSENIILQARKWCAPFGFETDPDALPPEKWL
ncbi:MAG: hypothetical protein R3E21_00885 [Caenibius sp.]